MRTRESERARKWPTESCQISQWARRLGRGSLGWVCSVQLVPMAHKSTRMINENWQMLNGNGNANKCASLWMCVCECVCVCMNDIYEAARFLEHNIRDCRICRFFPESLSLSHSPTLSLALSLARLPCCHLYQSGSHFVHYR